MKLKLIKLSLVVLATINFSIYFIKERSSIKTDLHFVKNYNSGLIDSRNDYTQMKKFAEATQKEKKGKVLIYDSVEGLTRLKLESFYYFYPLTPIIINTETFKDYSPKAGDILISDLANETLVPSFYNNSYYLYQY